MAKICLDAGHGGKDPGAVGFNRKEKDDVLKLTKKVGSILTSRGHSIVYTRTTDVYESPSAKAKEGNASGASFFASFHRNSASASAKGFETLVYANSGKAKTCADAASKKMAAVGFTKRPTKIRTDLAVLRGTTMSAVLFEVGFITNKSDNSLFDSKFNQIAEGLADAIEAAVGKGSGSTSGSSSASGGSSSRGSFTIKVSGVAKDDVLNIRAGAGASYKKTGELKYNDPNKYTIVQTKKNGSDTWGKLKSGIGWINLRYTKRV